MLSNVQRIDQRRTVIDRFRKTPVGVESNDDFDATDKLICGCVICQECRAARALQIGRSKWLDTSSLDADLQAVIAEWANLPDPIQRAIVALIRH